MKVEIKIDPNCKEPKIVIHTDSVDEEINTLVKKLTVDTLQAIVGFKDETVEILELADVFRFYSEDKKVFASTQNGEYTIRLRLYEIENRIDSARFIRISNSEIINIKKVKKFDLSFTGTICVSLSNGITTFVSRRFVPKIKQLLGI